jgi:heme-degrading monooxygenase HmoA
MKLLIFLFKSGLSSTELLKVSEGRESQYLEVKGLIQKYYVQVKEMDRVGGVFVFDTEESLAAFRESDLAKSTGEAYRFTEPPHTRVLDIVKTLR